MPNVRGMIPLLSRYVDISLRHTGLPTHALRFTYVALLLVHIQNLGLLLNSKKSKLQPSEGKTYLGMVVDSRRATIVLIPQRQQAFKACLGHFQLLPWVD